MKLLEGEAIWEDRSINFLECCDCSLVHAIYFKKLKNGKLYLCFERDDTATNLLRQKHNIKITKKGKTI